MRALLAAPLAAALLAAPAAAAPDPFEAWNRGVHAFNRVIGRHALDPVAGFYHAHTTPELRRGLANAAANLREPLSAASHLAAGRFDLARNAVARFGINTTLGRAGWQDRAAELGHPRAPASPADALCHWGVPSGPYLVLPLLGPSTLRDAGAAAATGAALSALLGPDLTLGWSAGDGFLDYAAIHAELSRLDTTSLDPYAVIRSAWLQRRASACPDDHRPDPPDAPEAEEDPGRGTEGR
jgi:phospholipid-binding lipoprotein MlaA